MWSVRVLSGECGRYRVMYGSVRVLYGRVRVPEARPVGAIGSLERWIDRPTRLQCAALRRPRRQIWRTVRQAQRALPEHHGVSLRQQKHRRGLRA